MIDCHHPEPTAQFWCAALVCKSTIATRLESQFLLKQCRSIISTALFETTVAQVHDAKSRSKRARRG